MRNKMLSLILAVAMLVSCFPAAYAYEESAQEDGTAASVEVNTEDEASVPETDADAADLPEEGSVIPENPADAAEESMEEAAVEITVSPAEPEENPEVIVYPEAADTAVPEEELTAFEDIWMDRSDVETDPTDNGISLLSLDQNGLVALKSGRYANWIDRIDIPKWVRTMYNGFVEATDGDKVDDAMISGPYEVSVSCSASVPSGMSVDQALEETINEAVLYMFAAYDAFDRDHPEVFWLSGYAQVGITDITVSGSTISYSCSLSVENGINTAEYPNAAAIYSAISARDSYVAKILKGLPSGSEYEKLEYLNQWLVMHNEYNSDVAGGNSGSAADTCWRCISALKGRVGAAGPVCEGYSRAFKVLCDKIGIPCILIDGTGGSGDHMWNGVQVDGNWYAVDVTWNDPVGYVSNGDPVSGWESNQYLLVGSSTEINGQKFSQSHQMENQRSPGGTCFTNQPSMSTKAYEPTPTMPMPKLLSPANTVSGVQVTWNAVSGAEKYRVLRKETGGSWAKLADTTATTYTDTTAVAGTAYSYSVKVITPIVSSYDKTGVSIVYLTRSTVSAKNTSTGVAVSWTKVPGATGYYLYRSTDGETYTRIATTTGSALTFTDTGRTNAQKCMYKVFAYRTSDGKTYKSPSSKVKTYYWMKTPAIASVTNSAAGKATIAWSQNKSCTGYQIQYETGTTSKIVSVRGKSTLTTVLSSLTKGSTYKISVRSYKTVDEKNYYSAWSTVKTVKIVK